MYLAPSPIFLEEYRRGPQNSEVRKLREIPSAREEEGCRVLEASTIISVSPSVLVSRRRRNPATAWNQPPQARDNAARPKESRPTRPITNGAQPHPPTVPPDLSTPVRGGGHPRLNRMTCGRPCLRLCLSISSQPPPTSPPIPASPPPK